MINPKLLREEKMLREEKKEREKEREREARKNNRLKPLLFQEKNPHY